jgi:hypothetical protein
MIWAWMVVVAQLLWFVEFKSFETDTQFTNMGMGPIRRLALWRRRLEIKVPWLRFLRRSTTDEQHRVKFEADAKADADPPLSGAAKKFQRICGAVDALQEIENNLNIKRASRFGMSIPDRSNFVFSQDAYRDGFIRESEKMMRRVVRHKDRLIWWLVKHGVNPTDLGDTTVSLPMVDKIAKRFAIKLDDGDPLSFEGSRYSGVEAFRALRKKRQEEEESRIQEILHQPSDPPHRVMVAVGDDIAIPLAVVQSMRNGPWTVWKKNGEDGGAEGFLYPRPERWPVDMNWPHRPQPMATMKQLYIFVPRAIIEETCKTYPPTLPVGSPHWT